MSVSRGDGNSVPAFSGFDDLRVVQVDGLLRNDGNETGSPSLGWWQWQPAHEIQPVQERGEGSELVAIECTRLIARARQGPTPDIPEGIDAGVEWGFDTRDIENRSAYSDEVADRSSYDNPDSGIRSATVEDDSPSLWFLWDSGVSIMRDEANATGASSDQAHQVAVMKNFRSEFGGGPLFDRHDRLFMNAELQKLDPDGALEYQMLYSFTLFFNDFEMGDSLHF